LKIKIKIILQKSNFMKSNSLLSQMNKKVTGGRAWGGEAQKVLIMIHGSNR
jgi:hypothetical protein